LCLDSIHLRTIIEILTELSNLHTNQLKPRSKEDLFNSFSQYVPIVKDAIENMEKHKVIENDDAAVFYKLAAETSLFAGNYPYSKVMC